MSETTIKSLTDNLTAARVAWALGLTIVGVSMFKLGSIAPIQEGLRYMGEGLLAYAGLRAVQK